ncbi:hypothetical protein HPB52_011422 [Rhipicephalus sanguineus]|uniref:Uncharacterized protein n=1 Tax=Rhipicephalus sanguineus TaxID=34632 RepID=A0A9D4T7I0_RHISA|nr:hypothetical protein HPB52_011422 [Rhipicephalus sanguineus]
MPALESLCIAGLFLEASTAARLGGMIAKVKSVRSVKFLRNNMPPEAGEELMKGVCQNSTLEVIWLSHNAIGRGGAHLLGDYLATSFKLRDLSLCSLRGHHEEQLAYVTEGLKTNRGLERLQIDGCRVAPGCMVSFAEVLKNHGTLKHVTVTNCLLGEAEAKSFAVLLEYNASLLELDLSCNTIGDIGAIRLAGSLKFNVHLQKLNLAVNSITSHGAVPLVEALASNRVLKELHLWYVGDEENDMPLASALNRTAVHGRVRLRHDSLAGVLQLSAGLLQNADLVTSLHLCASVRVNAHCLEKLFISLATIPCLNSLVIKSKTSMNGSAADRFAELLLATRTLKRVQINRCDARSVALQTVMGSLAKNETVSHMEVQLAARSSASTRAIVDMLNSNTTLTHFGNITAAPSELQLIARRLRPNRVLTSLKVYTMDGLLRTPDLAEAVFEINEVLRRNVCYLNRAVEFAMNPEKFGNQRHPAALFEELYHSESFKDHLVRIAGPDGAVEAVRNARRHIQENLLAITGVVRQLPVTCWPHPEGARQIDTLDTYSWLNVLAYLKITDIVV